MSDIEKKSITEAERADQSAKMHRHIAEVCDRECCESIHDWHRRRREHAAHDRWVAENHEEQK